MLGASSSALGNNVNNHDEQLTTQPQPTGYGQEQREISGETRWEVRQGRDDNEVVPEDIQPDSVHDIEQPLEPPPTRSLNALVSLSSKKIDINETSTNDISNSDEDVSDHEGKQSASPFQCLFCSQSFTDEEVGLTTNLKHMRTVHGLYIPDLGSVFDLQSFIGYLATEVRIWHECLYCGATKSSTQSVQSHMRDKGHCLLNFDQEPELLDFWDSPRSEVSDNDSDGEHATRQKEPKQQHPNQIHLSETEIRFSSGKVISSRHGIGNASMGSSKKSALRKRSPTLSTVKALPSSPQEVDPSPSQSLSPNVPTTPASAQMALSQRLAYRDELSIVGISTQQRQALVLAEKKAQRSEAVARRAREWVYAKQANLQKYDQVDTKMKMGKQNHKLQPR